MDILLLAITIVSLLMALFLGIAAWGMWREERARSAARVAALVAAADEPAADAPLLQVESIAPTPRPAPWNAPPDWRRLPRAAAPLRKPVRPEPALRPEAVGDAFLGTAVAAPASGGRQRGLAIAAVLLFVALVSGGYFVVFGERGDAERSAASPTTAAPLELISLRHERDNGALSIAGLVRNPGAGQAVEKLSAVVFLFNAQGEFVSSSRAGVDFTQLQPGDESPFVVRVNAPATVARYRVSFRTDAGLVPHIDRRGQEPIARELP
jgi:hypothetical protein